MPDPRPILPPDDSLDDRIADEIAAEAMARHPRSTPEQRERFVRLYTLQVSGEASAPGKITDVELGQHLGRDPRRIGEDAARALQRLKADPRPRDLARAYLSLLKSEI